MSDDSIEIGVLSLLPDDLKYLVAPALEYGVNQFGDDVDSFLVQASDEELKLLEELAGKVLKQNDYARVNKWLDQYPITDYQEAACLYFLFGILDTADFRFD